MPKDRTICYMGDSSQQAQGAYLSGIMDHYGLEYLYVGSKEPPPQDLLDREYSLYVLSDYPAAMFARGQLEHIALRVEAGAGLAMFGGWASYHGENGEYDGSPLAEVLPVLMKDRDDRVNRYGPCVVKRVADHAILADLPWDNPPVIGGYNDVRPKDSAELLLTAVSHNLRVVDKGFELVPTGESPLLVTGRFGGGRTAALATDVAPHWVGGLVDWGEKRLVQGVGDRSIDVGNWYGRFFCNLLVWTAGLESQ